MNEKLPVLAAEDIGIIVLAAGYSRRYGQDKRLLDMPNGRSLLGSTLASIPDDFSRRLLVLHPGDEKLAEEFGNDWPVCFAGTADQGMGSSLACAVQQIPHDWQGSLIALADMPLIKASTYLAIRAALCKHALVRPAFRGREGNPCGFRANYFANLATLRGEQGARSLLQEAGQALHLLECKDPGILLDIDKEGDLQQLAEQMPKKIK